MHWKWISSACSGRHTQQSRCSIHVEVLLCSDCFVLGRLQCEYCYYTTYTLIGPHKLISVARVPIWTARRALSTASYCYRKYAVNTAQNLFKNDNVVSQIVSGLSLWIFGFRKRKKSAVSQLRFFTCTAGYVLTCILIMFALNAQNYTLC